MKRLILSALLATPTVATADVMVEDTPVCMSLTHLEQANEAKKRNDIRGMGYLVKKGHCFYVEAGTEYSVIRVNFPEDPAEWAKIRAYSDEGTVELYTWYGFVR